MIIETDRLILRPVTKQDTHGIAQVVFSDPNVVGMLAHDIRTAESAITEAERWTSIMGIDGDGGIWDDGGMGLFSVVLKSDQALAGVAGFYMERNEHQRWNGEYFYALGTQWHGRGLMSEAADALGERLRSLDDLGVIYAGYWDMINEASGRILRRTGLKPEGRKSVTEEYGEDRCRMIFEFDLWRLSEAAPGNLQDSILVQVARRAGAFVAEDIIAKDTVLNSLKDNYGSPLLTRDAVTMLETSIERPGMAYLEIRGAGHTDAPENRLK
ncbi:GNAT family N-acetyltransferase [Yoonia sediminilitoris]|uniref:RimJ/RimL family protein N-acetyltransferase n=1 Tax=Yoonia sediminilitoris TaxID=1286148 RepID=A0A2T6KDI2_9RHOB|nr:GNAT family N-acetyltransferase [Yoonia sediminilitoris]PUB13096.1 RimJ/RimL family protein N-acetyltransferase [Yoonia sediminilitoris]RCW94433.1 RimJ/RimL family protein N-acetyltransferase [Yoonia sediminilitoris]